MPRLLPTLQTLIAVALCAPASFAAPVIAMPSKAAAFQMIDTGYRDIHAEMLENCQKAVKPVTHTIQIEE